MSARTTSSAPDHPRYRADIDGLRAVAVLSVVGFHAFPGLVPGGFIGVDIFFVISGYLISAIILGGLEHERFDFFEFYSRRVRRIFPALLFVLVACYLVGWNILFSTEFRSLNKHIVGGGAFISNLMLWSESGYFNTAAESKPLLHLWSLGIEEQFYLIWPLLLSVAWRSQRSMLSPIAAAVLLSFAANVMKIGEDPVGTFYFPYTRFWELMIGSALAYVSRAGAPPVRKLTHLNGEVMAWTGAGLIALALLLLSKDRDFPGWWALLPTVGAALLIGAGPHTWLNRKVLSNRTAVWLGLISFPLYLWHWPLLTFERILEGGTPSLILRVSAVLVAVLLAWLTFRFIEVPIRSSPASRAKAATLLVLMTCLVGLSYVTFQKEGQGGMPRAFLKLNPLDGSGFDGGDGGVTANACGIANRRDQSLFGSCVQDSREPPRFALWGDSKAAALFSGLVRTSAPGGRWLFIGGNGRGGTAVPVLATQGVFARYHEMSSIALESLSRNTHIETVVIVTATRALFQLNADDSIEDLPRSPYYSLALRGLSDSVSRLTRAGKKVVLVVDNPSFPDPTVCLRRVTRFDSINAAISRPANPACTITLDRHLELSSQYRHLLEEIRSTNPERISVFDTLRYLCDGRICRQDSGRRLLYSYTDHVSDGAAGLIGKNLNEFVATD
jgi:peptidoglycan/LPS O-acetylase OafA/YrhL